MSGHGGCILRNERAKFIRYYKYTLQFVECWQCLVTCRKFRGKTVYKHEFALNLTLSMGAMKSVAFVIRLTIDLFFFFHFLNACCLSHVQFIQTCHVPCGNQPGRVTSACLPLHLSMSTSRPPEPLGLQTSK